VAYRRQVPTLSRKYTAVKAKDEKRRPPNLIHLPRSDVPCAIRATTSDPHGACGTRSNSSR
jgi:hypothetical protein